jgi:hypothetical protein
MHRPRAASGYISHAAPHKHHCELDIAIENPDAGTRNLDYEEPEILLADLSCKMSWSACVGKEESIRGWLRQRLAVSDRPQVVNS